MTLSPLGKGAAEDLRTVCFASCSSPTSGRLWGEKGTRFKGDMDREVLASLLAKASPCFPLGTPANLGFGRDPK